MKLTLVISPSFSRRWWSETAHDAELTDHLGYDKNDPKGNGNSRNGNSKKRLKGVHGDIDLDTPRDRDGTFEP